MLGELVDKVFGERGPLFKNGRSLTCKHTCLKIRIRYYLLAADGSIGEGVIRPGLGFIDENLPLNLENEDTGRGGASSD